MIRTAPTSRGNLTGPALEVWCQAQGHDAWHKLESARAYRVRGDGLQRQNHSLVVSNLPVGEMRFWAKVVIQMHYAGSTDVRFLPRADMRMYGNLGDVHVEIVSHPAELPTLPPELAGWETRHPGHLGYTANRRTLQALLASLVGDPQYQRLNAQPAPETPTRTHTAPQIEKRVLAPIPDEVVLLTDSLELDAISEETINMVMAATQPLIETKSSAPQPARLSPQATPVVPAPQEPSGATEAAAVEEPAAKPTESSPASANTLAANTRDDSTLEAGFTPAEMIRILNAAADPNDPLHETLLELKRELRLRRGRRRAGR